PVIRIYNETAWDKATVADLRSGMLTTKGISGQDLRTFLLSLLPLPEELIDSDFGVRVQERN
ncbi:MAG TPA: hypothetical protein VFZ34_00895, partial [Blastocatellia bacterium]|nr:hypothetical protein [Blastocatellia bacterium]